MPKYINKDAMSAKEKESLRLFATMISAITRGNGDDLSNFVSNYLIKGQAINPITKKPMDLPGLPKKDENPQNSLNNIKDYFEELFETFPFDKKAKDNVKNLDNNFRIKFSLRVLSNSFSPDQEVKEMDRQMKSGDKSTYENYLAYARVRLIHESRPKPKWYEFGKRYSQWKEGKQVEKFERLLISKGVKTEDLERAKRFDPARENVFQTKPNYYDQLKEIDKELRQAHLQVSEYDPKAKASSKTGQEFLKHAMKAYDLMYGFNIAHSSKNEFEKEAYENFQYVKDIFDEMVSERIEFDTTTLEDLKEEIQAKDHASKNMKPFEASEKVHVQFDKEVFSETEVEYNLDKPLDDSLEIENELEI